MIRLFDFSQTLKTLTVGARFYSGIQDVFFDIETPGIYPRTEFKLGYTKRSVI